MKSLGKKLPLAFILIAAVLAAVLGHHALRARTEAKQEREEFLWQREAFAELDRLYADGAFHRQFNRAVGKELQAERMEARMEEARERSGSLDVSTADIDQLPEQIHLYP